jgi:hypothetical protein
MRRLSEMTFDFSWRGLMESLLRLEEGVLGLEHEQELCIGLERGRVSHVGFAAKWRAQNVREGTVARMSLISLKRTAAFSMRCFFSSCVIGRSSSFTLKS